MTNAIKEYENSFQVRSDLLELESRNGFHVVQSHLGRLDLHFKSTLNATFTDITSILKSKLYTKLKEMKWPKLAANQILDRDFISTFLVMTRIKSPDYSSGAISSFTCLARHYRVAFKFHFLGSKPTNQLDKPEYYLNFILTSIKEQAVFLEQTLQIVLDNANLKLIALHEFIAACCDMVQDKITNDIPKILEKPHVFRHTLIQLLLFDSTLDELYLFGMRNESSWKGCAGFILGTPALVDYWLGIEERGILIVGSLINF